MNNRVTFTYKNYRGEVSVRLVRPIMVSFGTTGFHPEAQWLLHAWDCNKEAERTFAMKDIKDWEALADRLEALPFVPDGVVLCGAVDPEFLLYSGERNEIVAALRSQPQPSDAVREAVISACMRLQQFLDTFGDLGGCTTPADLNDWIETTLSPGPTGVEADDESYERGFKAGYEVRNAETTPPARIVGDEAGGEPNYRQLRLAAKEQSMILDHWGDEKKSSVTISTVALRNAAFTIKKLAAALPPAKAAGGWQPSDSMPDDLEERVLQFQTMRLPGQQMSMHMGTLYLVNELWREVQRLRSLVTKQPAP